MALIKKNLVSILCGLIALAAVGLIFYPIGGMYVGLKKSATERQTVYKSVKDTLIKSRPLPQIELVATGEKKNLEVFPTRPVIEAYKAVTDKVKEDSQAILKTAIEMNARPLLVADSLPQAGSAIAINFKTTYQREMDLNNVNTRANSMAARTLKAGFFPNGNQVNDRRTKIEEEFIQNFGQPGGDQELAARLRNLKESAEDELRKKVRNESLMYLEPKAMDAYAPIMNIAAGGAPTPTQIYIAQVGYWVQQDILTSLRDANKDSTDITTSAVKHLFSIRFPSDAFKAMESIAQTGPNAPPPQPEGVWPTPNLSVSISGRATNPIYDVIKFDLQFYADAEQVPRVLQDLSRGKFITVLNCGLQTVDTGAQQARGWYYGDKPVVQVDVNCEALLLREWTKPLMPPSIRASLGVPPDAPKTP